MRRLRILGVIILVVSGFGIALSASAAEPEKDLIRQSYEKSKEFILKLKKSKPAGRKEKLKFVDRWLYMNRNTAESIPDNIPLRSKKSHDAFLSETAWVPLGPENLPPSYESRSGHGMGRINCVAFHPTEKNIFWIGTPGGGIWKTLNGGKSWMPQTDQLETLEFSHIAVDPKNPDILYAATGDYDGKGYYSAKSMGVAKSTDGGTSWTFNSQLMSITNQDCLKRVLVNSDSTNCILACSMSSIVRSTDSGVTWTRTSSSVISDMAVDPVHSNIVYAATGTYHNYIGSAGIMKSTDFGTTWTVLPTGIVPMGKVSRIALAVSPADPNYIYALTVSSDDSNYSHYNGMDAVYLSTDAGASWSRQAHYTTSSNILGSYNGDSQDGKGQGFYDLVLIADAKDKHKVYSGGINIWSSSDDGKNWELVSLWMNVFGKSIHADHHDAAYNPLDSSYYWCNDGGIYRTKEILPGSKDWVTNWIDRDAENVKPGCPDYKFPTVWENLSNGLMITEFYRLAICKNVPDIVAGGSQDNSCFYNNNANWINYIANYDGMETAIDHNNPEIIYGVWQGGGLCKSTDGGKTVRTGLADTIMGANQEDGLWITPLAMDPIDPNTLYIGFRNLWRSQDGGLRWEKFLNFDENANENTNLSSISLIKTSYTDPKYISVYKPASWTSIGGQFLQLPQELWITKDGGENWSKSEVGDYYNLTSIEYDRINPEIMWATASPSNSSPTNIIAKTTDGGATWNWVQKAGMQSLKGVNSIVHQGDQLNTLYVGTDWGVFYTNDESYAWEPLDENLPNAIINDLEIDFNSKRLYAASYGRGIWSKPLNKSGVVYEKLAAVAVYPNPSRGEFNLDFTGIESATPIQVKMLDVRGGKVFSGEFPAGGPARIATDLPTGVYFIVANINGKTFSAKIEITK